MSEKPIAEIVDLEPVEFRPFELKIRVGSADELNYLCGLFRINVPRIEHMLVFAFDIAAVKDVRECTYNLLNGRRLLLRTRETYGSVNTHVLPDEKEAAEFVEKRVEPNLLKELNLANLENHEWKEKLAKLERRMENILNGFRGPNWKISDWHEYPPIPEERLAELMEEDQKNRRKPTEDEWAALVGALKNERRLLVEKISLLYKPHMDGGHMRRHAADLEIMLTDAVAQRVQEREEKQELNRMLQESIKTNGDLLRNNTNMSMELEKARKKKEELEGRIKKLRELLKKVAPSTAVLEEFANGKEEANEQNKTDTPPA